MRNTRADAAGTRGEAVSISAGTTWAQTRTYSPEYLADAALTRGAWPRVSAKSDDSEARHG